jgi:hypothetical protein
MKSFLTFRTPSIVLAAIAVASLSVPSAAKADTIDFLGVGRNAAISATLNVGGGSVLHNVLAGELNWAWVGTVPEGFARTFFSYCIDLVNPLRDPQVVTVQSSEGFTNGVANGASKAAWLLDTFAPTIHAGGTNTQAAALQVAIWEAMYDTSNNLLGGNFRLVTSNGIRTQASAYLAALYSADSGYHTSLATVLATSAGQDQITAHVSEPSTLLLLGSGLALLARRRKRAAAAQSAS